MNQFEGLIVRYAEERKNHFFSKGKKYAKNFLAAQSGLQRFTAPLLFSRKAYDIMAAQAVLNQSS